MKKLLTILGAVGLTASTGASVIACGNPDSKSPLAELSLEELNVKLKERISEIKDFIKDHKDDESSEVSLEMNRLVFEFYSFIADIFLETDYLVDGLQKERSEAVNPDDFLVITSDNEIENDILCYSLIAGLKQFNEGKFKDNENYVKTFTDYINKLEGKKDLSNLELQDLTNKLDFFKETIKNLIPEINPDNEENPNIDFELLAHTYSMLFIFNAKVFLQTDYALTFGDKIGLEDAKVIEAEGKDYQALLQKTSDNLNSVLKEKDPIHAEVPFHPNYEEILQDYLSQLKDKLEDLGN